MGFMEQYGDIIISGLTVLSGLVGFLYVRAQSALRKQDVALKKQEREIQEIKSAASTRDQQIKLTQQLAESNAKRELLYTQQSARQQELWQKSVDNLSDSITEAIKGLTEQQREDRRELLREQKEDRNRFIASLDQNTNVVKNINDVMEVWVLKSSALERSVETLVQRGEKALQSVEAHTYAILDNSDHLLLTVEAIRDRIFRDKDLQIAHNSLVQIRLDEILALIKRGELQHEPIP